MGFRLHSSSLIYTKRLRPMSSFVNIYAVAWIVLRKLIGKKRRDSGSDSHRESVEKGKQSSGHLCPSSTGEYSTAGCLNCSEKHLTKKKRIDCQETVEGWDCESVEKGKQTQSGRSFHLEIKRLQQFARLTSTQKGNNNSKSSLAHRPISVFIKIIAT